MLRRPTLEDSLAETYAAKLADSEAAVLKSLYFQVMYDREEVISPAEAATLDWIFRPPPHDQRRWDSFGEWLESPQNLYWINGKAGSGKSTLMKYLIRHDETRSGLMKWAGHAKLLTASFFFWYSGGFDLQRSQIGLLRGLLHACLVDHRELIPLVVPETATVRAADLGNYWSMPRLKKALCRLVSQTKFDLKFCFFIDSLDEYGGGSHSEIAALVKEIANHASVKVCVSSRPLAIFDPAFCGVPRLILQNLTFDDIALYVTNKLTGNELMRKLEKEEPGLGGELTTVIVVKSSGVFLWVSLVVVSLLDGLSNHDIGHDLKRRLDDLPSNLKDLYWHLIDRVKLEWYLEEGFRLLRIVQAAGGQINMLQLCLAESAVELHGGGLMTRAF